MNEARVQADYDGHHYEWDSELFLFAVRVGTSCHAGMMGAGSADDISRAVESLIRGLIEGICADEPEALEDISKAIIGGALIGATEAIDEVGYGEEDRASIKALAESLGMDL